MFEYYREKLHVYMHMYMHFSELFKVNIVP